MASDRHLGRPAVVQATQSVSWAQVHALSIELGARLPGHGPVVNLCTSRLGFLTAWLAALRSGRAMWLPPSSGRVDLIDALNHGPSPCVVVDERRDIDPAWPAEVPCVVRGSQRSVFERRIDSAELPWQPSWDAPAVVLHTSGSTGRPTAHAKTLLQLAWGALAMAARLWPGGEPPASQHLLSSVVPSHMFGFETSVMLPLIYGLPVFERRPLLAADMDGATAATPHPYLWVTTPAHLVNLVRSGTRIDRCGLAVCSTMPLSTDIASRAQALIDAPLVEIYGSTETGALATRITARESEWTWLAGVFVRPSEPSGRLSAPAAEQVDHLACSAHFESPVRLADRIEVSASGGFNLLGRDEDLLKIGGRRASLASLNLLLLDMPGLRDGVLFVPDPSDADADDPPELDGTQAIARPAPGVPTPRPPPRPGKPPSAEFERCDSGRLCLVYSSDELDRAQIERWWRQQVAAVFVPRVIIRVDRVPRNALGKAPRAALNALYLQWQRRQGSFEVAVPVDHPAFAGHFPSRPVVPGALLMEAMLSGVAARAGRRIDRIEQARFVGACLPGDVATARYEVDADRCHMSMAVVRDGRATTLVTVVARCEPAAGHDRSSEALAMTSPLRAARVADLADGAFS